MSGRPPGAAGRRGFELCSLKARRPEGTHLLKRGRTAALDLPWSPDPSPTLPADRCRPRRRETRMKTTRDFDLSFRPETYWEHGVQRDTTPSSQVESSGLALRRE